MDADNPHANAGNTDKTEKVSVSGNLSVDLKNSGVDDIVKAIKKETTSEQQTENRANVIAHRQVQQQGRANNIAVTANLIGLGMFVATIWVFALNIRGISAATRAANAADSTVTLSHDYDSISLKKQQNAFESEKNFFNVAHRSYLAMFSEVIGNIITGKKLTISYRLLDIVGNPAQIKTIKCGFDFDSSRAKKSIDELVKKIKTDTMLQDVVKEYPADEKMETTANLTKKDSTNIENGNDLFYLEVVYYNSVNQEWGRYCIVNRIKRGYPNVLKTYKNYNEIINGTP